MGILAFLTASRLKAELTRQRDEIARLHQMLDVELSQKQEMEKQFAEQQQQIQQQNADQQQQIKSLTEEQKLLKVKQAEQSEHAQEKRKRLKAELDVDRQKIQTDAEGKVNEMNIRLSTLRQELDDKQDQRAEITEKNTNLAKKSSQLDAHLNEMAAALQQSEDRINQLVEEKKQLEVDLQKIMGNLTRW
ncbi:MAG TPA: hypothetical protein EYG11_17190 [Candidatus Latescibacteria bacterium]|nr:hypothetical protein [Candidatus Handelsmanbacteria bacterium]HIL10439.1 hypothetical protein [Candidatus Latescibacterota bacterium]